MKYTVYAQYLKTISRKTANGRSFWRNGSSAIQDHEAEMNHWNLQAFSSDTVTCDQV